MAIALRSKEVVRNNLKSVEHHAAQWRTAVNAILPCYLPCRKAREGIKQGTMQGKSRHQSALPDIPKDHPLLMPRVRAAKKAATELLVKYPM